MMKERRERENVCRRPLSMGEKERERERRRRRRRRPRKIKRERERERERVKEGEGACGPQPNYHSAAHEREVACEKDQSSALFRPVQHSRTAAAGAAPPCA